MLFWLITLIAITALVVGCIALSDIQSGKFTTVTAQTVIVSTIDGGNADLTDLTLDSLVVNGSITGDGSGMVADAFNIYLVNPAVVDGRYPRVFSTIQGAIDAAEATITDIDQRRIVYITSGTYTENIVVTKRIVFTTLGDSYRSSSFSDVIIRGTATINGLPSFSNISFISDDPLTKSAVLLGVLSADYLTTAGTQFDGVVLFKGCSIMCASHTQAIPAVDWRTVQPAVTTGMGVRMEFSNSVFSGSTTAYVFVSGARNTLSMVNCIGGTGVILLANSLVQSASFQMFNCSWGGRVIIEEGDTPLTAPGILVAQFLLVNWSQSPDSSPALTINQAYASVRMSNITISNDNLNTGPTSQSPIRLQADNVTLFYSNLGFVSPDAGPTPVNSPDNRIWQEGAGSQALPYAQPLLV